MNSQAPTSLPLCATPAAARWHQNTCRNQPARDYHHCPCCKPILVPAALHLDAVVERAGYGLHHNDPADEG